MWGTRLKFLRKGVLIGRSNLLANFQFLLVDSSMPCSIQIYTKSLMYIVVSVISANFVADWLEHCKFTLVREKGNWNSPIHSNTNNKHWIKLCLPPPPINIIFQTRIKIQTNKMKLRFIHLVLAYNVCNIYSCTLIVRMKCVLGLFRVRCFHAILWIGSSRTVLTGSE